MKISIYMNVADDKYYYL